MVSGTLRMDIASWRKIHCSDENHLHMIDGRTHGWKAIKCCLCRLPKKKKKPIPSSGDGVGMHFARLQVGSGHCGPSCGPRYQRVILETVVIPHFDNHDLATRPVLMDDNARPYRTRTVMDFLQRNAITTIRWPARSPDLNTIEHLSDIILGRRVRQRHQPVQNIADLSAATRTSRSNVW